jgi:hypothetical protein
MVDLKEIISIETLSDEMKKSTRIFQSRHSEALLRRR